VYVSYSQYVTFGVGFRGPGIRIGARRAGGRRGDTTSKGRADRGGAAAGLTAWAVPTGRARQLALLHGLCRPRRAPGVTVGRDGALAGPAAPRRPARPAQPMLPSQLPCPPGRHSPCSPRSCRAAPVGPPLASRVAAPPARTPCASQASTARPAPPSPPRMAARMLAGARMRYPSPHALRLHRRHGWRRGSLLAHGCALGRLRVGCRSVAGRRLVGCRSAFGRLQVGVWSASSRLQVGCRSAFGRLQVGVWLAVRRVSVVSTSWLFGVVAVFWRLFKRF